MDKKQPGINTSAMLNVDLLEEQFTLTDAQQTDLASLYEGVTDKFVIGKIIQGNILKKEDNGLVVDIGYKSNGFIPNYEFTKFELKDLIEGTDVEIVIDRLEDEYGSVVLSYQKAKSLKAWDRIAKLADADEPVRGVVTHKVKGGLSVDIGIPAFLPGSQVDIHRVNNFDQFVGQEVICKILKINMKRGNIIISRRKNLEEQRFEDKKKALETITEGQVVQGVVKNITNYGAFVDIGGIDGLLHITDMSWGRIGHPSEMIKLGDEITVKVLTFDKEHEKISLGLKQLQDNPWDAVTERYAPGTIVKGKISSITDYGLFVEAEKGVEGLIHISEISWTERVSNLARLYTVGSEIEALVVALDIDNRRMSLSVKRLTEDPWKLVADKFKEGDKIEGTVSNITDFGLFVRLDEGIDGLVHISDLSWTEHVAHPSEHFKKSDTVEAMILSIDPASRKISLGIKQLQGDPWDTVPEKYPVGTVVEGTVSKITSFGAFIKLDPHVEGLVHISELSPKEVEKVEDVVTVGEKYKFKVIKLNPSERKLGLSIRALTETEPRKERTKSSGPRERREDRVTGPSSTGSMSNSLQQALSEHLKGDDDEGKE